MAEIPPPPDELPDGFSLDGEKKAYTVEDHYRHLIALTEEIRDTYRKLLDQRTKLIRDLERIEQFVASAPRIIILAALGALMGMATYHLIMILITQLSE